VWSKPCAGEYYMILVARCPRSWLFKYGVIYISADPSCQGSYLIQVLCILQMNICSNFFALSYDSEEVIVCTLQDGDLCPGL